MSWTVGTSRNSASGTFATRNTASYVLFLRHGVEPRIKELADFTFNDVVFPDGTVLKDLTFAQLADAVWTYQNRNT